MKREKAKELWPILKAYAEGKVIQKRFNGSWLNINCGDYFIIDDGMDPSDYRVIEIKHEPKYRPFKDAEELWQELQKHQPFGFVKTKRGGNYTAITWIDDNKDEAMRMLGAYIFPDDGTPFGIKVEEDGQ
jgi:hypothetical protein